MKRGWTLGLVLSLLLTLGMTGSPAKPRKRGFEKIRYPELRTFTLPEIQKADLGNGVRVRLIREDKLPLFELSIRMKGGKAYDPSGMTGLHELLAATLRVGGTGKHSPDEMDRIVESSGIRIGFSSHGDYFEAHVSALVEDFDQAVGLLAEMMLQPAFVQAKLDEVKTQEGSVISRRNDDPRGIIEREFPRLMYGKGFPLTAVTEYADLERIGRKDLLAASQRLVTPDNMMVGITGALEMKQVLEVFERHFGSLSGTSAMPAYPEVREPARGYKVAFAEKSDLNQSFVMIGHMDERWNAEESAAISVFNSIFSQGMDSRLFNRVRTKEGLTYGVGGGIQRPYLYPGVTAFFTFTKSASTLKAVRAMTEEMERIRKGLVTTQELSDAKEFLLNSHVFKFSSPDKILARLMNQEFYGLPENLDDETVARIRAVTAEDVLKVAQSYMHPDKMFVFILGKEADLDGKLSELGTVQKVDIAIPPPPLKETFPEATPESEKKAQVFLSRLARKTYKAYLGLKGQRTTMDMSVVTPQGEMAMSVTESQKFPGFSHKEIHVMGMKIDVIMTPEGGLMSQMGQKKPMPEEAVRAERFGDLRDLLLGEGTARVQYLGSEDGEGGSVDVLLARGKDDDSMWRKLAFDPRTGYLLWMEMIQEVPGMGKKPARVVMSDYRMVGGIPVAHQIQVVVGGKPSVRMTVKKVELNPTFAENFFSIRP